METQRGYDSYTTGAIAIVYNIGAICGGLFFGALSQRIGRKKAIVIAALLAIPVAPLWVYAPGPVLLAIGAFLMQFFVQGAWGIVPAHVNELSPNHLRGFFPGFAYQLGVMFAASIPYVESRLGEHFTYTQAMGGLVALVFVVAFIVVLFGPEAKGVSFRKHA